MAFPVAKLLRRFERWLCEIQKRSTDRRFQVQQRRDLCPHISCSLPRAADRADVIRIGEIVLRARGLPPGVESIRIAPDHETVAARLEKLQQKVSRDPIENRRKGVPVLARRAVLVQDHARIGIGAQRTVHRPRALQNSSCVLSVRCRCN